MWGRGTRCSLPFDRASTSQPPPALGPNTEYPSRPTACSHVPSSLLGPPHLTSPAPRRRARVSPTTETERASAAAATDAVAEDPAPGADVRVHKVGRPRVSDAGWFVHRFRVTTPLTFLWGPSRRRDADPTRSDDMISSPLPPGPARQTPRE